MILARLEGGGGAATSSLSGLGARVGGGGGAPPPSLNENECQMENSPLNKDLEFRPWHWKARGGSLNKELGFRSWHCGKARGGEV